MPGGAFPSSFEQAEKGTFLDLMPELLTLMSLYKKIIKYFDVTPGSQITWTTCSGIINRYKKEKGESGVKHIFKLVRRFDIMVIVEISIVPLGTGSTNLSPYVAACKKFLSTGVRRE